ncbi:hypothetical protein JRI60_18270 [Archangium violaceum]|uniref:hypothetical protein n=1 Tax=Archangium violaceum TaxID=83451 RepID=UPI00194EB7DE|nr:hypothetical protein [Archangium violaceum]QRO00835.1 hypothetical protein JRI60_18270 [Archangium violaceum]
MRPALLALALALVSSSSWAAVAPEVAEAQRAQMEKLRAEVAGQIQLQAYDLLDELVYGWTQQPVFELETPVVLADVTVPVGFGSGLAALIENHFANLVVKNPRTRLTLAHCPQCTAVMVHSGAKGTIVSRGVDQPEALAAAGALSGARHAIFLDFEAEGSALVLRARITSLEPALPIIHARTLTTSTSSPALLRSGDQLKSATEARKEYLDALQGRGVFTVPMRIAVRSYGPPSNGTAVAAMPFIWLQVGTEMALTQARAWTGTISAGVTWMPQLHTGFMAQARISRLLTGSVASLTRPDLYVFVGGSVISIHGQGARVFQNQVLNLEDVLSNIPQLLVQPHATFAAFPIGLELRVGNRIGASVFLESAPALDNAPSVGAHLNLLDILKFHTVGAEVTFCF